MEAVRSSLEDPWEFLRSNLPARPGYGQKFSENVPSCHLTGAGLDVVST